jgi:alpha-L-fucosidase
MRYAVLTAKHVAGHCLWPTRCTPYSVAASGDTRDVVGWFVDECRKKGVLPGLYYCSWDNHNRFGSKTPSDAAHEGAWLEMNGFPPDQVQDLPFYTTSLYQAFQTAQLDELLTQYGPIEEVWIDIPGVLGAGYRSFLYRHIAELQPDSVTMMNCCMEPAYDPSYAFPADIRAFERSLPGEYDGRVTVGGKSYEMPGEFCRPIGEDWFYADGDVPRSVAELEKEFRSCRRLRINYLLDVPPDRRGLIPDVFVRSLTALRKGIGI